MEQIVDHKERVIEQLLSVSAELSTFVNRGEWNRIDRLIADRASLVDQLMNFSSEFVAGSPADRQRWHMKIMAAERLHHEVADLIQKYQSHLNTELKGSSEQKSLLLNDSGIDPKGNNLVAKG